MATLHLELDIDSDVHPELYVRLASIARSSARQEKLRQLAATGLIWEIARLHGPAFREPEPVPLAPPASPASTLGDGFLPALDAGSVSDHPSLVPQDVPLLVDVVDEAELGGSGRGSDSDSGGIGATALSLVRPADAAVDGASGRPSTYESPIASASPVVAPGSRTRSARIKRMKDSGLFQNG
jgi:hypothetical protein